MRTAALIFILCGCGSTLSSNLLHPVPDAGDPNAASLSGFVVDSAVSMPIAGAVVLAGTGQATTASDGSFSLDGLKAGEQMVQVTKDGYFDGLFPVQLMPGGNDETLEMILDCSKSRCPTGFYCGPAVTCEQGTGPANIVGQVTDCAGNPRMALVTVQDDYGKMGSCTDAQGRYRITGRTGGESVTLIFSAPGFDDWSMNEFLSAGDNSADADLWVGNACPDPLPAPRCQ